MTAADALREGLRGWGETVPCDACEAMFPADDNQCQHSWFMCPEHLDECRHCAEEIADARWAEDAADEQREAS